MYISIKKRSTRNESLFVFAFVDKEDFECFCINIEFLLEHGKAYMAQNDLDTYEADVLLDAFEQLKSRVDNRYANEKYQLSGCLFADEAGLFFNSFYTMQVFAINSLITEYRDLMSTYSDSLDARQKELEDNNRFLKDMACFFEGFKYPSMNEEDETTA